MIDNALNNEALPEQRSKGMRTQEKILQSAIHCISKLGHDKTTFQAIADHCGISQPLVVHYFKRRENLFPAVIDYLTQHTRKTIDTKLDHASSPTERLRAFVRISLTSVRTEKEAAKVFLTLSLLSAFDKGFRDRNAKLKQVAANELIDILAAGVASRDFDIAQMTLTAKMITSYIMGVRMNLLNDSDPRMDDQLIQMVEDHCLLMVKKTKQDSSKRKTRKPIS